MPTLISLYSLLFDNIQLDRRLTMRPATGTLASVLSHDIAAATASALSDRTLSLLTLSSPAHLAAAVAFSAAHLVASAASSARPPGSLGSEFRRSHLPSEAFAPCSRRSRVRPAVLISPHSDQGISILKSYGLK